MVKGSGGMDGSRFMVNGSGFRGMDGARFMVRVLGSWLMVHGSWFTVNG